MTLKIILLCTFFGIAVSTFCGPVRCKLPAICPTIIWREDWGARKATDVNYAIKPVNYSIIHHTVTDECNNRRECTNIVRSIQNYHMDEADFGDIGYNFLVGGDGNVYEGVGWHRIGAHTLGYNSKSIGVAFIGNFVSKYPTNEALNSGKDLMLCGVKLDELIKDYKLVAARQISGTTSPGPKFYREIQTWPNWVENI